MKAKESRSRAGRTSSTEEQLDQLLSAFRYAANEVARIKAFHALRLGCSERIRQAIDQLTMDNRKAKQSGVALVAALEATRENLHCYVESNQQLSTHCTSNETVLLNVAKERRRPAAMLRSVSPKKSESTITGAILPVVK